MGHRIGIGDFEASFLEIIAVIELGAADKEGALRVDYDIYSFGGNKDVAGYRAIDQIHLVLKAGTTASNHGNPQGSVGAPLFGEQGGESIGGGIRDPAELFISDFPRKWGSWFRRGCLAHGFFLFPFGYPVKGSH